MTHSPELKIPPNGKRRDRAEAPSPPDAGLAGRLLWWILSSLFLAVGSVVLLSWRFGMEVSVEGKGTISPRKRRQVKSRISGLVKEIRVRQGKHVEQGDVLAVLEGEEWRVRLRKVEKDLEINRSRRKEIEISILQQRSILQVEVEQARAQVERIGLQLEQISLEQQLYSTALLQTVGWRRKEVEKLLPVKQGKALLRQKQAELTLAEERLRSVEGRWQEVRTLEREREKLLQERSWLRRRLAETTLRAPTSGTVLTRDLEQRIGDRIQAGETLLELAEMNEWQAEIAVKETDVPKVKPGQPVRLYVGAFPHMEYKIFTGKVEEVGVEPVDGGYPVKISIADPEVQSEGRKLPLACGMSAEGRIVVEEGRIAVLVWRRFLRSLGKASRQRLYLEREEESR